MIGDTDLAARRAACQTGLVKRHAEVKGWYGIHLDHGIWRFTSGRPHQDFGRDE